MANDCPRHAGQSNEDERFKLDHIMENLLENQSGGGRHKCSYCAYEQGFKDGLDAAIDAHKQQILTNVKYP